MTEELKRCPFCKSIWVKSFVNMAGMYQVVCYDCYAAGPTKYFEAEAITAWNRREPIGNSEELPEWMRQKIEDTIKNANSMIQVHAPHSIRDIRVTALRSVLAMRRDE